MLDDKYRIERLLATGGMGAVYLGTHIKLRKRVAIKVLNPQLSSASMVERFHREAITASQIGHEGIAQVTDLGTSSEGEPFLVMEYLEGEPLASWLRGSGPISVEDACEIGCAILSPLSAAHRAGIVHRDLKPDNVFLVRQSRGEMVKLLDFGISHASGLEREFRLTNTGLVLGTPYYMSPEQARGESEITPAADLYAFGVILYEMLVGEVPIRADNYNQLMYRVTMSDFARPRERRPDLPEELEQVVLHAMAQAPEDRPVSALELEKALLAFCRPAFRDRATGRISSPGLLLKPLGGGTTLEHAMFAAPTVLAPHLNELGLPPDGTSRASAPGPITGRDDHASRPALPVAAGDDPSLTAHVAPRRSPAARLLTGIAIVAAGAAAAGSLVIMLAGSGGPSVAATPTPPTPPVTGATTVAGEPPIAQPAANSGSNAGTAAVDPAAGVAHLATTITLRLAVVPSGAAITLDGAPVSGAELVVPKDAAAHRLRITAAGYLGYDEAISFDESQRVVVQLKRTVSPTRGKPSRKDRDRTDRTDRTDQADRIESKSPYE
jgi:serine/threonine-protein kinase